MNASSVSYIEAHGTGTPVGDGIIDGFRWCLLGGNAQLDLSNLAIGLAVTLVFLWLGIRTFRATEKTFADLV